MHKLLLTLCLFAATGCSVVEGSGHIVSENRDVSGFDSVDVCCGFQVTIKQGANESLKLRGDDNILDDIDTQVRGGTLVIDYDDAAPMFSPTRPVEVIIEMIDIERLVGSGGADIEAATIQGRDLDIDLSGGSRLTTPDLDALNIEVELSGGSVAELSGTVKRQSIHASGGSWYQAEDLQSRSADIEGSGGSMAFVWATEALEADLSGGSHVDYAGSPTITKQTSGGSRISPR